MNQAEDHDAVDLLVAQWQRERPDVAAWPMAVVGRISRASRLLEQNLKKCFAEYGLESHEFDVLATLRRSGEPYELTAKALLKSAMVTSGAITNRLDRTEAKGLIERLPDSEDRRSIRIRLTPAGLALIDTAIVAHTANEQRLLAALDSDDLHALTTTLRRLLISLGDSP